MPTAPQTEVQTSESSEITPQLNKPAPESKPTLKPQAKKRAQPAPAVPRATSIPNNYALYQSQELDKPLIVHHPSQKQQTASGRKELGILNDPSLAVVYTSQYLSGGMTAALFPWAAIPKVTGQIGDLSGIRMQNSVFASLSDLQIFTGTPKDNPLKHSQLGGNPGLIPNPVIVDGIVAPHYKPHGMMAVFHRQASIPCINFAEQIATISETPRSKTTPYFAFSRGPGAPTFYL
eukprot:TRINITY_DN6675_c0_g1_i2.p1 TRINITY_DN6675_c0_g1~~TRINITY_DN6675_c0_g1_i2.p1  ORF type:complete len:234 (-),score=38.30 TRINITY_DN6675_c0_g1_i2:167-868(-)